jgi:hypothetical protein
VGKVGVGDAIRGLCRARNAVNRFPSPFPHPAGRRWAAAGLQSSSALLEIRWLVSGRNRGRHQHDDARCEMPRGWCWLGLTLSAEVLGSRPWSHGVVARRRSVRGNEFIDGHLASPASACVGVDTPEVACFIRDGGAWRRANKLTLAHITGAINPTSSLILGPLEIAMSRRGSTQPGGLISSTSSTTSKCRAKQKSRRPTPPAVPATPFVRAKAEKTV